MSVGADRVAEAIADEARRRGLDIAIVRTGSRGLFWLEPLVEVETAAGRIGYGPVAPGEAAQLFEAGFLDGGSSKALGRVDDIPYLARQQRLIFARCGQTDPLSLDDYRRHGGLRGLERALTLGSKATVEEVLASGLRGRGGAGFPTGIKWRTTAGIEADQKYVVCNADEGDSGTFADRMLMEGDPFLLIEGMTIAASRSARLWGTSTSAPNIRMPSRLFSGRSSGRGRADCLGASVLGSGHAFDLEARLGAGAYICGEETSLLESLEGKRGQIRAKPPLPAIKGLFGKPTVINNVLSFASTPMDPRARREGLRRVRGRPVARIAAVPARRRRRAMAGSSSSPSAPTLRELVEGFGGGARTGRPLRAVQVGGPLGAYFPANAPRHAARLRSDGRGRRHAGPWRRRRVRRQRRHGAPGAVRVRILRQGKLRQVHALPDRFGPRGRDGRQDHRRPGPPDERRNCCAIFAR